MTTYRNSKCLWATSIILAVAAVALACFAFAPSAYANRQIDAPTTVSDDITRLHVNKLDADTHEYVQGAKMAIIEKDTGTVVDEWVSGTTTYTNEKALDVDKVYILREVAAPDGYDKVEDTEFMVNATEGTGITILSGPGELTESYKVNLYDKAQPTERETVVNKTRGATSSSSNSSSSSGSSNSSSSNSSSSNTVAPKTGDETPLAPVAVFVVVGILAIIALEVPKRRMSNQSK